VPKLRKSDARWQALDTATKRSRVITKHSNSRLRSRKMRKALGNHIVRTALADDAVTNYRKLGARPRSKDPAVARREKKELTLASEEMGEVGAVSYLHDVTGATPTISRPTAAAPFNHAFDDDQPWPVAIAFNGNGVADIVHWDGKTLHVVEAKGGASALSTGRNARIRKFDHATGEPLSAAEKERMRVADDPTRQMDQGTLPYLMDIACQMTRSKSGDNRAAVGRQIRRAIQGNFVEYVPVSTALNAGHDHATVTVIPYDVEEY
jgi:hypothetical protein